MGLDGCCCARGFERCWADNFSSLRRFLRAAIVMLTYHEVSRYLRLLLPLASREVSGINIISAVLRRKEWFLSANFANWKILMLRRMRDSRSSTPKWILNWEVIRGESLWCSSRLRVIIVFIASFNDFGRVSSVSSEAIRWRLKVFRGNASLSDSRRYCDSLGSHRRFRRIFGLKRHFVECDWMFLSF